MLRPAGILVPDRRVTGLIAGFGQIESQVIRVGMVGEVACSAVPFTVIPVVVTQVQDVIASGQVRPTDQLVDAQSFARPGTITAYMEPLFEGAFDRLPPRRELHRQRVYLEPRRPAGPGHRRVPCLRPARDRCHRPRSTPPSCDCRR